MAKKHMKKMFNIPGFKGNADLKRIKILPHPCQNGYPQETQQQMLARMCRKRNPHTLLVRM
jgi:hypothetical protein